MIDEKDAPPLHCGCGTSFQNAGDFIKHFGKCWGHGGEKMTRKAKTAAKKKSKGGITIRCHCGQCFAGQEAFRKHVEKQCSRWKPDRQAEISASVKADLDRLKRWNAGKPIQVEP